MRLQHRLLLCLSCLLLLGQAPALAGYASDWRYIQNGRLMYATGAPNKEGKGRDGAMREKARSFVCCLSLCLSLSLFLFLARH